MNLDEFERPEDEEPGRDPEELEDVFDPDVEVDVEDLADVGEEEGSEDADEDAEESEDDADETEEAKGAKTQKASKGKAADGEEEEEEVAFADKPLPKRAELMKALEWAFEGEEDLPTDYLERCAEHALLVQKGNRRMNLTKIVEPREIAAKHYLDSWRTLRQLPLLGRRVLDIGTGAGYPGVPIALGEPNCHVKMIDATKKKADFVRETVEAMGIPNVSVEWGRAEEFLLRNRFDVAIMRAISSVRENVRLLRKVRHSIHDLVMMKGPSWSREVRAGEREAERLGFRLDTILEHELPGELGARAVLVYRAPGGQGR